MPTTIQIKRSSTASAIPVTGDIAVGELAVNLADKRLYTKQSDGTIIELSTSPTDLDADTLRIDGVEITASATELNKLDGFTGSTTELNILDGVTATTAELNFVDGVTSNIQTQLNGKATTAQGALADTAVQPDDDVEFNTGSFTGDVSFYEDTGTTAKMVWDAGAEILGVGTTAQDIFGSSSQTGVVLNRTLYAAIQANNDGANAAIFNRLTSDGSILQFRKDGSTVGAIGAFASSTSFCGASAGIYFNGTNINPTTGDPTVRTDGVSDIGQVTQRFRDLYLSGGVFLGGTGAANKLDDYEEGSWTPTNNGDSTGTVTSTGSYTKVGKQVTVQGVIRIDSDFTSIGLAGLPFMPSGSTGISSVRGIFNTFSESRDLYTRLIQGTTLFNVYLDLNGTPAYLATTDGSIRFLMSYETDA